MLHFTIKGLIESPHYLGYKILLFTSSNPSVEVLLLSTFNVVVEVLEILHCTTQLLVAVTTTKEVSMDMVVNDKDFQL